jgi:hypothetical protein
MMVRKGSVHTEVIITLNDAALTQSFIKVQYLCYRTENTNLGIYIHLEF